MPKVVDDEAVKNAVGRLENLVCVVLISHLLLPLLALLCVLIHIFSANFPPMFFSGNAICEDKLTMIHHKTMLMVSPKGACPGFTPKMGVLSVPLFGKNSTPKGDGGVLTLKGCIPTPTSCIPTPKGCVPTP